MLASRTAFAGRGLAAPSGRGLVAAVPKRALVVENAHKKGAGSTKNGRDSKSKRRGVKSYGGQPVRAGGIIVRQLGSSWHAGDNVGTGKDYTLFSTIDGMVVYSEKDGRARVSVYPMEHAKAQAAATATHTTKSTADGGSRKERRRATYKPRGSSGAAAAGEPVATVAVVAAKTAP
ncbi:50S ribosomal protein L27 [Raphidocelis subcapitata]|uniref:50S ribosomal protein L27 n=1 Tax=Raphidocelis subcapitata TaxID=307507 RepID=A0A2V0NMA8_9CHLO|nr:50S ribosomal protein L27 [Raphidocelis subcapitata]|eukprot:GBF88616.1 50S ribosomal protein L27 [Raphidocelis subcapitata]